MLRNCIRHIVSTRQLIQINQRKKCINILESCKMYLFSNRLGRKYTGEKETRGKGKRIVGGLNMHKNMVFTGESTHRQTF